MLPLIKNTMKNKIIVTGFISLGISIAGCGKKVETATTTTSQVQPVDTMTMIAGNSIEITEFQFKTAGIELGLIEQKNLSEIIQASGKLDVPPQNFAEVSTYIGGVVKSIRVLEGDFVKKGQTILTLEHPDFVKLQQEYLSVKSQIVFLEKEYLRQKELYEQKVSSGKVFQQAESAYNGEKGHLASLESQLAMLSISTASLDKGIITKVIPLKAPISGYIGHLKASLGGYAEPNKSLFDVIDNTDLHVHLDVFEKDLQKLKIGQKLIVNLPNQDGSQIEAVIFSIGKMLNEETKAVEVHADIKNNKRKDLIPGIYVSASIKIDERNVNAVPEAAVVRVGEKQYIFVVNDSTTVDTAQKSGFSGAFRLIEVKTGSSALGFIEIMPIETISNNKRIVTKGAYFLISQLKSSETIGCCPPGEEKKK